MLGALLNIFVVPELRRKVLITMGLIFVYRLGAHMTIPFIDPERLTESFKNLVGTGGALAMVDLFSGGGFRNMTIFALGIMPYISASIIIQLLTAVMPRLEKISKEGEAGRKKITQWTRYGTVGLSVFQGIGIGSFLLSGNPPMSVIPNHPIMFLFVTAMTLCTGTCFIMWLGEKISQHGIGNGISIIIAVGIICRYPYDMGLAVQDVQNGTMTWFGVALVLVATLLMSAVIIFSQQASRKVPVQHARRMVGRKMMQGGNTFIPLKLNTAGVIPVIFASAILSFPGMIIPYIGGIFGAAGQEIGQKFSNWLSPYSTNSFYGILENHGFNPGGIFYALKIFNIYTIMDVALIVVFCFFYTAITLNPIDLADNLKKSGAFIPGIKPGKNTADFIDHILIRITVVGAAFLIVIALMPEILVAFNVNITVAQIAGGTGLIIVVGVILDTMKQIESQLVMRHYEGFKHLGRGGHRPAVGRLRPSARIGK